MTKVLGLIGGMSWRTTELYYRQINQTVSARLGGLRSANLRLVSLDYANVARWVQASDFDSLTQHLCESGHQLQRAGAEALVLCANVAHKAAGALEQQVGLPVLHVADFAGQEIIKQGHRRVGLLATRAVMEEDFYKKRLVEKYGLEVFTPEEEFCQVADQLIFGELSKEPIPSVAISTVHSAYAGLVRDHHVDCILLACTEFRLVFNAGQMSVPTFDSTILHAKGAAEWALNGGVS